MNLVVDKDSLSHLLSFVFSPLFFPVFSLGNRLWLEVAMEIFIYSMKTTYYDD